jgi:hypothetical protein
MSLGKPIDSARLSLFAWGRELVQWLWLLTPDGAQQISDIAA